jgi:hypothetical protein
VSLSAVELADARAVGVAEPERIRLLCVDSIPFRRRSLLHRVAVRMRILSPHTAGLTARYGILVRQDFWRDRELLVHEFAHTAQYESCGGIRPFLRQYLRECLLDGYPFGELERHAAAAARRLCG